jgi:hypothetical protein
MLFTVLAAFMLKRPLRCCTSSLLIASSLLWTSAEVVLGLVPRSEFDRILECRIA